METRKLGTQGLAVSELGLGCMGMSQSYGKHDDDEESVATIHRAIELGVTFFDTAEVYGPFVNEELLGKAIRGKRDGLTIATKFGFKIDDGKQSGLDGSPAQVKRVADASLKRLGLDVIDLYYQHRRDPNYPIEETVGAMKELVEAGKVRYLGLSEVNADTLRRSNAVHPISALQSEYSLWERGIEAEILPAARELGIGLVPFSPLGRGYLTGNVSTSELGDGDMRKSLPRFDEANADANRRIVELVKRVAERHQATPAQIALAWVLAQGGDIAPIPGTKRRKYLEDNVGAADVRLTRDDLDELDGAAALAAGERYNEKMQAMIER